MRWMSGPGGKYIDCTVGEGGHSAEIRMAADPAPRLLGLDVDEEALSTAKRRLGGGATLVQGSYRKLKRLAETNGFMPADGGTARSWALVSPGGVRAEGIQLPAPGAPGHALRQEPGAYCSPHRERVRRGGPCEPDLPARRGAEVAEDRPGHSPVAAHRGHRRARRGREEVHGQAAAAADPPGDQDLPGHTDGRRMRRRRLSRRACRGRSRYCAPAVGLQSSATTPWKTGW